MAVDTSHPTKKYGYNWNNVLSSLSSAEDYDRANKRPSLYDQAIARKEKESLQPDAGTASDAYKAMYRNDSPMFSEKQNNTLSKLNTQGTETAGPSFGKPIGAPRNKAMNPHLENYDSPNFPTDVTGPPSLEDTYAMDKPNMPKTFSEAPDPFSGLRDTKRKFTNESGIDSIYMRSKGKEVASPVDSLKQDTMIDKPDPSTLNAPSEVIAAPTGAPGGGPKPTSATTPPATTPTPQGGSQASIDKAKEELGNNKGVVKGAGSVVNEVVNDPNIPQEHKREVAEEALNQMIKDEEDSGNFMSESFRASLLGFGLSLLTNPNDMRSAIAHGFKGYIDTENTVERRTRVEEMVAKAEADNYIISPDDRESLHLYQETGDSKYLPDFEKQNNKYRNKYNYYNFQKLMVCWGPS